MDKKVYKKLKKKTVRPWSWLTITSGILAGVFILGASICSSFDNSLVLLFGGTFWELENEDPNAIYYKGDFKTEEERLNYGYNVVKQVEAEGATLLMNNNTLPLQQGAKISCFSNSSVNLVYGGTGSGNVDASKANTLRTALEGVGFSVNDKLWDFYTTGPGKDYKREKAGISFKQLSLKETPWNLYTDEVKNSVKDYGDAAIVVLSRVGGEGYDLEFNEYNYLALTQDEKDLLTNVKKMKDEGTVKKIIVLINTSNALQVDFLKNNEYGVDAAMWIGGVGVSGIDAVADIILGKTNPSGRLVDTYCYDNLSSPAMKNFLPITYKGYEKGVVPSSAEYYMVYQEGIYVGYKYYETRYEDYVMNKGNTASYNYHNDVAYPFGYGLSYSSYEYDNYNVTYNASTDRYNVTLDVTNTGLIAGKETVQIYAQTPYSQYDIDNGIENSSVQLVGFNKTDILQPGQKETLNITIRGKDLATYDSKLAKTYIYDAGEYYLTAAKDAHDAVNNILAAKGYTPSNTSNRMDNEGNSSLTYKWTEAFDSTTYSLSDNGTTITNQLDNVDPNMDNDVDDVKYLSRNNWEETFPKSAAEISLNEALIKRLQDCIYNPDDYEKIEMPTLNAKNGLKLYDLMGVDFDDPKWQQLLDQLSFDEMVALIGDAFHWTMPVESIHAPGTRDENGPQGLTVTLFGAQLGVQTTSLTSEDIMAATFNRDLIYEVGKVVGNDCVDAKVAMLYGPGNNIHRTPYSGRNFEYHSEDGYLTGEMSASEVRGIEKYGVKVLMKHFALNDHEAEREGISIWANEQSIREIYLKGFQAPIEEEHANGVMTSYSRWGTSWAGAHKGLITNILRKEWGCNGLVLSDNAVHTYMNGISGVMAGSSAYDAMMGYACEDLAKYENDPVAVQAMKDSCHTILYAIASSCGMNGIGKDTTVKAIVPACVVIPTVLAVTFSVAFAATLAMWIVKYVQFRKTDEYKQYHENK